MPYGLRLKVHHAGLVSAASTAAFQAAGVGSNPVSRSSRSTLQSLMEEGMCHQTAYTIRRVQQLLHSNSQKVKTFSSQEKIVGSIPTSINTRLVHMVDSSKWSGGLPLTQKIVGSSPLSTTTSRCGPAWPTARVLGT